jgi:uncharacterized protein YggE
MKNQLLILVTVAVLLMHCQAQTGQCVINTFKISGNAVVNVNPTIAIFSISTVGNGASAALALQNLNGKINSIVAAFKANGVPNGNYSTSSINIYNTYNYSTNPYTITGSQATQYLQLTIGVRTNLPALLKSLSGIPDVNVQNIAYDVLDRSSALQKARLAAFADAKNKFAQYLSLAGEKNLGLLKIQDLSSEVVTTYTYTPSTFALITLMRVLPSPVQVRASVSVTWRVSG